MLLEIVMAKKQNSFDYTAEIKLLKSESPKNLYLLSGEEDYLRDRYLETLKTVCIPEGENGFSYKRFDGPTVDAADLGKAIDIMPFLSERTFVELRNVDINKTNDTDQLIGVLSSIPEYCTVCFVQDASYETDGRMRFVRFLKDKGKALEFNSQDQTKLFNWIKRRFEALGKEIDSVSIQRLVFISGDLMNALIPEIEKVAAYAKSRRILPADIEAVASHLPEADVFEMVNLISEKKYDTALHLLAELLRNKENAPASILGTLSFQLRRLYGIKLALAEGKKQKEIKELLNIRYDFIAEKQVAAAGKFSTTQLEKDLRNCVQSEYAMKTTAGDDLELLKTLFVKMIAEDKNE